MILAHLSELHLGFRAYERTERGRNARERDVAAAFERAVEALVRIGPDLVVVVGDVFDRADPGPSALLALTRGLDALRTGLPGVPVALVAGARDSPLRDGDDAALAVLESIPGVAVASRGVRTVELEALDARLCLLPWCAGTEAPAADGGRRWNVLAAYAAVGGAGAGLSVDPGGWSYIALGGEHAHRAVTPNAAYAGALERVGSSPWDEAAEEKGLLTVDLGSGRTRFHPLPVRPVVALAAVKTPPSGPAGLPQRVREVTREIPGGIEEKIVRLRVRGARQRDLLVLQGPLLAELQDRTLHLDIDVEVEAGTPEALPDARELLSARMEGEHVRKVEALLASADRPPPPAAFRSRVAAGDAGSEELEVPNGLVAVVAADAATEEGLLARLAGEGDVPPWLDPSRRAAGDLLQALGDALARLRGAGPLEAVLAAEAERHGGGRPDARPELERRLAELDGAEEELRRFERELREVRADHAEVAGDLEVATMDWLRERQDAETRLQAYRDRARELKARLAEIEASGADAPCPTCGRLLRDHYDQVLADLRDEWEAVVQDGRWWRRRRDQLELKPAPLQDLEGRTVRLQAAVEECAERVESARSRVRERDEARQRLAEAGGPARASDDPALALVADVAETLRGAVTDRLLETASRFVARMTGTRVLALDAARGEIRLEGPRARLPPAEEEMAAAEAALRLAGAVLAGEAAVLPSSLVERLREGDRFRLLDLLPSLRGRLGHIVVGMRAETAERRHDALDGVLEVGEGTVAWLPAGPSRLRLEAPAGVPSGQSPA